MASVCSARSNGSSKYRRISSTSSVDESKNSRPSNNVRRAKTKAEEVPIRKPSISLEELERIKRAAETTVQQRQPPPNPTQTEAAQARKEHMKQLELQEMEAQKKMGSQCDSAKLDRIRKQAQEKMDEGNDIVKLLKTCSERATTFAIRDQQLKDKAERDKKEHDYEHRMILAMEVDRLTEIEAREAEQARKAKKMIDDRKIIEKQIEERTQARLLREEARDQENREMLERIKLYQAQDEEKNREKKEKAAKARLEIIRANEEHISQKRELKLLQKKEDEMMVAYQLQKDEVLRQREAAEVEAERQKRALQKKMNDEHVRSMDKQADLDELRARRAMEDAERKYSRTQLAEARKKKRDMDALDAARKQQQQERLEKQRAEAEQKQEEYANTIRHAHTMSERERAEVERAKQKNSELIVNLQAQIEENAARRLVKEKEKYQEGAMIKQQLAEERAKLEAVREKMVGDMKLKGIDERYFGEMTSLDINKILMKY